ncbi:MAG: hypothetical protein DCF30_22355 [Hyphomicrobiales bacterium]|nr:MAG: hypothetical protein DCF30_22355 [Hyphomicrobiales bacterium]
MIKELRKLNESGIQKFREWMQDGASGAVPLGLITDPETSDGLSVTICPDRHNFKDRVEFGAYLTDLLKDLDPREISRDVGLWSALGLIWFDLICSRTKDGERLVREEYRYILDNGYNVYYRHLVRTPWKFYLEHGENARFLLVSPREQTYPLSIHSELAEQVAGRQRVIGSKSIIRAANIMYLDPATGRPRRGAAGALGGAALRFGKVVRQLDLTFDPEVMSPVEFIEILPKVSTAVGFQARVAE